MFRSVSNCRDAEPMARSRQSISKLLTSTVDTGEAERLLTTAMATSETLCGYTKDEVCMLAELPCLRALFIRNAWSPARCVL